MRIRCFHRLCIFFLLFVSIRAFGIPAVWAASGPTTVNLYFIDPTHTHLAAQQRQIPEGTNTEQSAHAILTALIEGPRQGLARSIPEGLSLRAVFISEERIAYVDFAKRPDTQIYQDVLSEWLTVCSIVNSLILNIPEIESVKLLLDGNETESLSGHIDLAYPFKANMLLIR